MIRSILIVVAGLLMACGQAADYPVPAPSRWSQGPTVTEALAGGVEPLKAKASAGDAAAAFFLGVAYENGITVPVDGAQAEVWYRRAVAGGDARAMNNLGAMLTHDGDADHMQEGIALLNRAAQAGEASAMANLASLTPDGPENIDWLKKAALAGSPISALTLGLYYETGRGGAKVDKSEALRWYRLATKISEGDQLQTAKEAVAALDKER